MQFIFRIRFCVVVRSMEMDNVTNLSEGQVTVQTPALSFYNLKKVNLGSEKTYKFSDTVSSVLKRDFCSYNFFSSFQLFTRRWRNF